MKDSVIERCAKAAKAALEETDIEHAERYFAAEHESAIAHEECEDMRRIARAVLQALREPSDVTVEAGAREVAEQLHHKSNAFDRCVHEDLRGDYRNAARHGWQAMIDTAINEGDA